MKTPEQFQSNRILVSAIVSPTLYQLSEEESGELLLHGGAETNAWAIPLQGLLRWLIIYALLSHSFYY